MEKIDYKKQLKHLYKASAKKHVIVDVPPMNYLMIDGIGRPEGEAYQNALAALFPLAYTIKFSIKKGEIAKDYGVMPLEGLWWADDYNVFKNNDKDQWKWTMMIMQPELVTDEIVEEAFEAVREKKDPISLDKVRFARFEEGKVAQILHIGPFSEEGPTIEGLHQFIENQGYQLRGKHHEIYLTDIRRAKPENWKTIIRMPIG
jgi:hypothetical protein